MSVSISWLLQQHQLGLALRAGPGTGREIQFAQATELRDPSPWLSGGELLLTTGLDLPDDDAGLGDYVRLLDSVGVAALAFGTGLSHRTVPAGLITAATELDLTLIEIPFTTPFAAVTKAVMARLAEQEYEQVLRAATVQTRITRAALRGGVDAIVRELSIATTMPVAFVGTKSTSVHPAARTGLIDETRDALAANPHIDGAASISLSNPSHTLTLQPVGVGKPGHGHGHLAIAGRGTLGNIDRILLGHAVSLLTLELEKPIRLQAEQTRLNGTAVALLLDGRFADTSIPTYLDDASDGNNRIRVLSIKSSTKAVHRHVEVALRQAGRGVFLQPSADGVAVLLRGTDTVSVAESLFDGLAVKAAKRIRVGLSKPQPIKKAPLALEQARIAATLANADERLVEFDSTTGSMLLASEQARETLLTIASATYPVLARSDEQHGTDLVASLRAYLEANGQWESAASQLGVHRHTLRSRIARIEDLLDCDLGQARVRAELLLALLAWEIPGADSFRLRGRSL
ncbi:PucR family transcriptional regulator [Antrihabitans cavernicola]|uniref:PucR family transcriptional regulator n=1 Tax=Antrihabitans cavernicola TaxID=2495913 RepID=A0A5A7SG84_9NOCA|nr:PucR family transcriptional regulator [Spelaeibacter cavernicola]KAA0024836.1 PucR family transcriptional regulator [Spelaeibacter cavernicola]